MAIEFIDEDGEILAEGVSFPTALNGKARFYFNIGNMQDHGSIASDHGFRHFAHLQGTDPEFKQHLADVGMTIKTRKRSHDKVDAEEGDSDAGSHRVEVGADGQKIKAHERLFINSIGAGEHAKVAGLLDKWSDHITARGGSAAHAAGLKFDAAKLRVKFGSGTDADHQLVNGGRAGAKSGTVSAAHSMDLSAFAEAPAKAAEPAAEFGAAEPKPKKAGKKAPTKLASDAFKESVAKITKNAVNETAKALLKLTESKKTAKG